MSSVIGVRVTRYEPNNINTVENHDNGRKYRRDDDGCLHLYASGCEPFKTYQPDAWSHAELVYGAPEPAPPTVGTIGNPITVTWNPYPTIKPDPIVAARMRLTAANQELEDAVLAFARAKGVA